MQVRFVPIALLSSTAATEESTPPQAEHHLVVAKLLAQLGHCGLYERLGGPVQLAAADVGHEVAQYLHAALRVIYLGVELHAPSLLAFCPVGCVRHFVCRCN